MCRLCHSLAQGGRGCLSCWWWWKVAVEGLGGVGVACWEQFLHSLGWSGHPQILLPAKEELVASASFPLPPSPELAVSLRRDTSIDSSKPSVPCRPGPLSSQPAGWCYTRRGTHSQVPAGPGAGAEGLTVRGQGERRQAEVFPEVSGASPTSAWEAAQGLLQKALMQSGRTLRLKEMRRASLSSSPGLFPSCLIRTIILLAVLVCLGCHDKCHRLEGLKTELYFPTVLESGRPDQGASDRYLGRAPLPADGCLLAVPHRGAVGREREREC